MSAGSEFALRIALCDLVERLKRSEQMCRYLEKCRNELAKELIRVKSDYEVVSKENSLMAASLEQYTGTSVTPRNKSPRPVLTVNNSGQQPSSHGSSSEIAPSTEEDNKSTDWEEITARLLQQLRKEVEQMARSGPEEEKNASVGSVFVSSGGERKRVTLEKAMVTIEQGEETRSQDNSKFGDTLEEVPGASHKETKRRSLSVQDGVGEIETVKGGTLETDLCVRLVRYLTSDLNKFAEQVASQNEKLTRIKSKQLRLFFTRQLNPYEEQGRRPHLTQPGLELV